MNRYQKVEKPKAETSIDENEIRITSQGRMRSYITYAMGLLLQEKEADKIVFKAMGRAINKTVTIVELIKENCRSSPNYSNPIHRYNRHMGTAGGRPPNAGNQKESIDDHNYSSKKELDKNNLGYQPPIPADQVKVATELDYDGEGSPSTRGRGGRFGRGRGRHRGQYGNGYPSAEYEDGGYEGNHGYTRGRGRGRGRGFRGRGKGGYNGPQFDTEYDAGGYNQ